MAERNRLNQEGVVIHNLDISLSKKIYKKFLNSKPGIPLSDEIFDFLIDLGANIRNNNLAKNYTDLLTFAFFCREGNLKLIKKNYLNLKNRLGRGNVFHITPSNIAINFAYSFVFGILGGNNNIVRVPSKDYNQIRIFMSSLKKTFKKKKFKIFNKKNIFVRYPRNQIITEILSKVCDVRVVWGGDKTIEELRSIKLPNKSTEIVFPDRYSFSIVNSKFFDNLNSLEISKIAKNFFNDTYIVDQNACSSPHLIIWVGNTSKKNKEIFWKELSKVVKHNYDISLSHSFEKYNKLIKSLAHNKNIISYKNYANYLYIVNLNKINLDIINYRGKYGIFFEYNAKDLNILKKIVSRKIQTLTYFGFLKKNLINFMLKNKLNGIDRIVPFGRALDLSLTWDGYDLIRYLSREIEVS